MVADFPMNVNSPSNFLTVFRIRICIDIYENGHPGPGSESASALVMHIPDPDSAIIQKNLE